MEKSVKKPERQLNFELLRIVAMVMILTLHYLGYGNMLTNNEGSKTYYICWILEALSYVAVNVYILISGYFSVNAGFKINKILDLWIQTAVIAAAGYLVALKIGWAAPDDKETLSRSLMPITQNSYWFITTYLIFCAVVPFLALAVNRLSQRQHKALCIVLVALFSLLPTVFFDENWTSVGKGMGIIWFTVLFFVASYIRKYDSFKKSPFVYFIGYLASTAVGLAVKFAIRYYCMQTGTEDVSDAFFKKYTMFFIFVASVFLFLAFKNIRFDFRKLGGLIMFFSSTTIYVYMIHEIPSLKLSYWRDFIEPTAHTGFPDIVLNYALGVFVTYLVCTLLGAAVKALYNLLQLPKLTKKISDKAVAAAKKRI